MEKIPFRISASKQDTRALIRITGEIGWDTDAELFRSEVDELIAQGVQDAHIYINSPGGSCFDAAEIVNILTRFNGKVTGEGGSLVASAATYIACHCSSFIMPENGMFMIHKPSGGAYGTANDISSYLKMITDIETQYFNIYNNKISDKSKLAEQWNAGDWWLTAQEAHDYGLVSQIKKRVAIDTDTAALITACGCPKTKIPLINIDQKKEDMDLKTMAKTLGLPESATETEINAKIEEGRKAQADLQALRDENERKEKETQKQQIEADVKRAVEEKRITADMAPKWAQALQKDYATNIELLNAISGVSKIPVSNSGINPSADKGKVTYMGKTFEELQNEDSDVLAQLQSSDPSAFDALFNDYKKRNKLD